jgi:outer membrane protein TolC
MPINLPSALAAVSGNNPQVAYANARIAESSAVAEAARVLWLPSIHAGLSYDNHGGPLQAENGDVSDQSRSALQVGLGMGAVAADSPRVAGVTANFHMADAIFQPRIADHVVAGREDAATTVVHDLLLSAALAYVDLLRACQEKAIAEETLHNAQRLADLTAAFARAGQGSRADADRAEAELAVRRNEVLQAEESTRVASARLAEFLHADATQLWVPQEPGVVPLCLVPPEVPLRQLVGQGMANRPELAESRELVSAASERLQREQFAPLVPSVLLGLSTSGFGGGPGDTIANFRDRFDFDAMAYWELRNLGCGDLAARNQARAQVDQARFRQVRLMDQVAREVVEAHVQVESRRSQIAVAEAGVKAAAASYRLNIERIRNAKGLPLEALQSIQALDQSRREYLRAATSYNEAQFRLHRALGWPICPADLQTPRAPQNMP